MTNTILIEKDGYVWIVSRDKRKSIRHGLGLLGVDLKVEDRRVEVPYEELVRIGEWRCRMRSYHLHKSTEVDVSA